MTTPTPHDTPADIAPSKSPALRWGALVLFIVGCQLVGILGALATGTGTTPWYQELAKPSFQPPGWLFGPVWTLLYAMMAIAAWRVWSVRAPDPARRRGLVLFAVQLALNAAWSPVFFGAHAIGWALVVLVALAVTLGMTCTAFRRVDRTAALLLVPYLAWVAFATVLNAAILRLN